MTYKEIIDFWFNEIDPKMHWQKSDEFDTQITERFSKVHHAAKSGELFSWRNEPHGRLAEIIVLDQFSRNMFRNKPESFAQDSLALALAQEAFNLRSDKELSTNERLFLYMPYMHSESLIVHEQAVKVFTEVGLKLDFEIKHKVIIERFGRYPHRNKILNRQSTAEEMEFLKEPGSSF